MGADLEALRAVIVDAFPSSRGEIAFGELTIHATPEIVHDLLAWARDDERVRCELLADLSGVHWPAGDNEIERQPATTGWPAYRLERDRGVIEVNYILRSLTHNHAFRVSVAVPDDAPRLPTATDLWLTANFHEREVYDFFGVEFTGHPNLTRILMPDDWVGHPHRKDYPLGGVDIPYDNDKFIPSPDTRGLRQVVD
ncbi:MAG: NADH-quinone oxidoreductase subunit C [Nitriliruptorales bacterium]|nr:NADH-quinone oxidoreductase subunit C [Nitriliruptorales bacterium]